MDPPVNPFPGKSHLFKTRVTRKAIDASNAKIVVSKDPPISRPKRVFGTAKSTNIPSKPINEKPLSKISTGAPLRQPKWIQPTKATMNISTELPIEVPAKKSHEKPNPKLKKESIGSEKQDLENVTKNLKEYKVAEPMTPVALPSLLKLRNSDTPFHSAEKCSKCRFDKLETSSYWLSQIKLAESVGKHFVSADFFRLAFDCNAEPIRNLRVELRRYLNRHEHLTEHTEWRDVCVSCGTLKDNNSNEKVHHSRYEKPAIPEAEKTACTELVQDQKGLENHVDQTEVDGTKQIK